MQKYQIVNEQTNSILCKDKATSRRYRQDKDDIDNHLKIVETTKGRAEAERDYLNEHYQKGWEIKAV